MFEQLALVRRIRYMSQRLAVEQITNIGSREKRVSLEETSQLARTVFSNLL